MGYGERAGTLEGVAGSEKVLPENFVPPPYPPTSSWQGPSLSPSVLMVLAPPGKGVQGPWSAWQLSKTEKGEGNQPFPPALRKGKLRH